MTRPVSIATNVGAKAENAALSAGNDDYGQMFVLSVASDMARHNTHGRRLYQRQSDLVADLAKLESRLETLKARKKNPHARW